MTSEQKIYEWKNQIKYLQIAFFVLLVVVYYLYGWFMDQKSNYENLKQTYISKSIKLTNLQDKKASVEVFSSRLEKVVNNLSGFIAAYNVCYPSYVRQKFYLEEKEQRINLWWCMFKNGYKFPYIKSFTDNQIRAIAISLWILKNSNSKFDYPTDKVLASLDKNIFNDQMEKKLQMLSFSTPSLIDKANGLYAVKFSFKTTANYTIFEDLFSKLQTRLFKTGYVYYTVNSISAFDITDSMIQPLLVQGQFYFTK